MALRLVFILLVVVALPTLIYVWVCTFLRAIAKWRKIPPMHMRPGLIVGWIVLACCVGGFIGINSYMARRARLALVERLDHLDGPYTVRVNGTAVRNPEAVVAALREVRELPAHHSSPEMRLQVEVEGKGGSVTMILARDSDVAREYWVYLPSDDPVGNPPGGQEIGRVTTPALDGR